MDLVTLLGNCQNPGEIELLWITRAVSHVGQVEDEEALGFAALLIIWCEPSIRWAPRFCFVRTAAG